MALLPNGFGKNTTGFAHVATGVLSVRIIYTEGKVMGMAMYDNDKDLERDAMGCETCYDHAGAWFAKDNSERA